MDRKNNEFRAGSKEEVAEKSRYKEIVSVVRKKRTCLSMY